MNKTKNGFFRLAFLLIGSVFFLSEHVSAQSPDYIFYTGAQSPIKEVLQQRLQEVFLRVGEKTRLVAMTSSQRALMMANEQGDGDAMRISDIKTIAPEATSNLIKIPEPVIEIAFYVYTRQKEFPVKGWHSLAGYQNGFRVGAKILEKNMPGRTTRLPDSIRLFKMLDLGRLDTVTEHDMMADDIIRTLELSGIKKLTPALVTLPGFTFIHKKHRHLVAQLAAALSRMKADGRFESIRQEVIKGRY